MGVQSFAWQEGYGAFTVRASQLETVRNYIQQQEEHHRTRRFERNIWSCFNVVALNSMNDISERPVSPVPPGLLVVVSDTGPVACATG